MALLRRPVSAALTACWDQPVTEYGFGQRCSALTLPQRGLVSCFETGHGYGGALVGRRLKAHPARCRWGGAKGRHIEPIAQIAGGGMWLRRITDPVCLNKARRSSAPIG